MIRPMNGIRTLLDGVFVSRPMVWVPVWGFCLFGYYRSAGIPFTLAPPWPGNGGVPVNVYLWIFAFSCVVGSVCIVNQLADADVDACNGGFALLVHGGVSARVAGIAAAVFGFFPVGVSIMLHQASMGLLCVAAAALGLMYSWPPLRFSGRPILDFSSNALGYGGIAFVVGWHLGGGEFGSRLVSEATSYVLLMAAGSISSTLPDYFGDHRGGKRTTAVWLGLRRAHVLATILIVAAAAAAIVNADVRAAVCASVAFPLYMAYLIRPRRRYMEATYKVGGAATMVVAALSSMTFALAGLVVLLGTRVYFRYRFGVTYPSLEPVANAR